MAKEPKTPRLQREPQRESVREPGRGRKEIVGRDGKLLSRKRGSNTDRFHIPTHLVPDGWSYEWKRESLYGQEDTAHMMHMAENGWRPVMASAHPGLFMPEGYEGAIRRDGMVLCERPIELTEEAQAEELAAARALQQAQKEQLGLALPEGFNNKHSAVKPRVNQQYLPADVNRPVLQIDE
jgi:hypothetical protein